MEREYIIQRLLICSALIFVTLTSGCAAMRMYTGEALPKEQVAVIKGSSKTYLYYNVMISIVSVDEELRTYPSANKVEVMPGFHKVVIMIWVYENRHNIFLQLAARSFTDYYAFEFTAESGQQYKIETVDFLSFFRSTVPVPRSSLIAVVDINSGSVVARQPIDQHRLFRSK